MSEEDRIALARIEERLKSLDDRLMNPDSGHIPAIHYHLRILNGSIAQHSKDIEALKTKADWMPTRNRLLLIGVGTIVTIGSLVYALARALVNK